MKTVVNVGKGRGEFQPRVVVEEAGDGDVEADAGIGGTLLFSSSRRTPESEKYHSLAHCTFT